MVDQYTLGGILASVFALVAIYTLVAKKKKNNNRRDSPNARSESVNGVATAKGECRSTNSDADVIVVGAGVAGAALAHTLGKVNFRLLL